MLAQEGFDPTLTVCSNNPLIAVPVWGRWRTNATYGDGGARSISIPDANPLHRHSCQRWLERRIEGRLTAMGVVSSTTTTTTARNVNPDKITGFSVEIIKLPNACGALTDNDIVQKLILLYILYIRNKERRKKSDYGLIVRNNENLKRHITAPDYIIIYIIYILYIRKKDRRKMKHVSSLNKNNIDKNKRHPGKQLNLEFFIGRQDFSENERVVVEVVLLVLLRLTNRHSNSHGTSRTIVPASRAGADSGGCTPGAIRIRKRKGGIILSIAVLV